VTICPRYEKQESFCFNDEKSTVVVNVKIIIRLRSIKIKSNFKGFYHVHGTGTEDV